MPDFLKQLQACPACGGHFADHQFALLASVPVKENDDARVMTFVTAIKNRDWSTVLAFQEWEGGYDDYELYAVRAKNHPLLLVTVLDSVELFDKERVVDTEVLNEIDSNHLLALTTDRDWKPSSRTDGSPNQN